MPKLKIYLVEDSPLIRENLTSTLEELVRARVVGWAEDEATAARWLTHPGPVADLLVVDLFLKGGSGMGVLREATARAPGLQRVVLSNYVTREVRRHCLALGANHVFDKSDEIDALIAYCNRLSGALGERIPA